MDIQTLIALFAAMLTLVAIGAIYFVKSPNNLSQWLRVVTSAYPAAIGATFLLVAFFWPESHRFNTKGTKLLLQVQAAPLILFVASLTLYRGPRRLHFVLVPASLLIWAWFFAMSWIHVRGM